MEKNEVPENALLRLSRVKVQGDREKAGTKDAADVWGLDRALTWIFPKRKLEIDLEEGRALNKQAWQLKVF